MDIKNAKLKSIVTTAYKESFFYKNICDIEKLEKFEDLPIICASDIQDQNVTLLAKTMKDAQYCVKTDIVNRYFSEAELADLTKKWNRRLKSSQKVLCLFDNDLVSYFKIFTDCETFVYPRASFDSCEQCVNVIQKYHIDTIIGTGIKVLTLAQYVSDNRINLGVKKVFILCKHYNEDLVLRINRYLSVSSICIKIIPEMLIEIGEIKDKLIVNKNIYPEIVAINGEEILPMNQYGELVITLLNNDIQPIVRFSSGHKTRMLANETLDIKSTEVFDSFEQLEEFIFQIEEVIDYNIETLDNYDLITLVALDKVGFAIEKIESQIKIILNKDDIKVQIKHVLDYVL